MNGFQKLKPSKPKYNCTWDVSVVLNYLAKLGTNMEISIEMLGKKVLTLLALTSGQRLQTLSLVRVENIITNDIGIEIKIPDRIKNTNKSKFQPCLKFPFFHDHPEICVGSTILCYLEITNSFRNNLENFLFLTYKKPIHIASKQTLSR